MTKRLLIAVLTLGYVLTGARIVWAQGAAGTISNLGNPSNFNLSTGLIGGGETMPGAVLVKLRGEVQCVDCTLEEMGVEEAPGALYQFSQENTHMVIKVTSAAPTIAWEMVEGHKLFLSPGEDMAQLQYLLSESKPGKRIEVTGGVAPEVGAFIPLNVKVK